MNTMGQILPTNWRITLAVLFSAVIIIGAYVLTRDVQSPPNAQASTESALLQAIATKDSSGDGLPDWEKALYGIPIDATTTDYFHLGMTDGEAVAKGLIVPKAIADIPAATSTPVTLDQYGLPPAPSDDTLTGAFAQNFYTLYTSAVQANGGADLSSDQINEVANQAVSQLTATVGAAPDFKSAQDLTVSGSGTDAMIAFARNAEAILVENRANATGTPLTNLQSALQDNSATALTNLSSIAKIYRDAAAGLAALPVPEELASADLELINAFMRMSEITSDFSREQSDPLAAMLALQQYQTVVTALGKAFADTDNAYVVAGVSIPNGSPGAGFVNVVSNVTASQQGTGNQ